MTPPSGPDYSLTRRSFLARYAGSLGSLALAHLLAREQGRAAFGGDSGPLEPRPPHHPPRARAVISLFQHGGPSQVDLFDAKPELAKRHGLGYQLGCQVGETAILSAAGAAWALRPSPRKEPVSSVPS